MAARVLAVLAAACFVGAFALATVLPPMTTLAEALLEADQAALGWVRDAVQGRGYEWVWQNLFVPMLMRPDWLLLTCLGMVFGGAALTVGSRKNKGVTRSHRRRS